MGYIPEDTIADENLNMVKKYIKSAIDALSKNVIGEERGWEDYTREYRQKQHEALMLLLEIRSKLNWRMR